MKMTVIIDGKEVEREVNHMERGPHGGMIQYPLLNDGEDVVFTVDGSVIIVNTSSVGDNFDEKA